MWLTPLKIVFTVRLLPGADMLPHSSLNQWFSVRLDHPPSTPSPGNVWQCVLFDEELLVSPVAFIGQECYTVCKRMECLALSAHYTLFGKARV